MHSPHVKKKYPDHFYLDFARLLLFLREVLEQSANTRFHGDSFAQLLSPLQLVWSIESFIIVP